MSIDYLNVPEELLDRPVWTWTPQIGDRVRVHLKGDCGFHGTPGSLADLAGFKGHPEGVNGITGQISRICDEHPGTGHEFEVQLDESYEFFGGHFRKDCFAADELEPLAD